ncbi:hypothetical protein Hanom_Chr14g01309201 [Helianthus anomalus]
MYYFRTMDCVGLFFSFEHEFFYLLFGMLKFIFFRILDIRFIIRIRIRNFGYPKVGYLKFRIRIRIVKSTIRNVRISEISDIRF